MGAQQLLLAGQPILSAPFSSIITQLHFDGADASTTFTDVIGKTYTPSNQAQIDTAQSVFGGASGLFDGTDGISTPNHADFSLGTGDFCIEFRVRFNATGTDADICAHRNVADSNNFWFIRKNSADKLFVGSLLSGGAGPVNVTCSTTVTTGVWYPVALIRQGNTFTVYLNGVADGTTTGSAAMPAPAYPFWIGCGDDSVAAGLNGWIDEFRFTKGYARYSGNYTPAAAAFADS